jgi:hypothetical protein
MEESYEREQALPFETPGSPSRHNFYWRTIELCWIIDQKPKEEILYMLA